MDWLRAAVPALLAGVFTLALTPLAVRLAVHFRAVDPPGGRKRHAQPMPRLGGIAIAGGIVFSLGLSLAFLSEDRFGGLSAQEMIWFGIAALIIFALGLTDDLVPLGPFTKLFFQLVAASIVVAIGWQFTVLRLPWEARFSVEALAPVLSVLWIVGVTNAINLIDGLDGLAAGIVAIISASLLILAILQGQPEIVIAASCTVGACVAFLRHNWRPAKIYMGDSGSLTLGFILAAMTLRSSAKASATVAILVPILALGLPVIDSLLVMWYRFLRGHPTMGRIAGLFHGDRKHLHHLLLETRVERNRVMLTLYGLVLLFCLMALAVATSGNLRLGIAFLVIEFSAVLFIRKAGLTAEARRLADRRLAQLDANATGEIPILDSADPQSPARSNLKAKELATK
ncbi:MAG: undecaprenyl/decaprenyl-phosphate alpha-N-acetylglucosaminyl 1-phosphate transferase [bacterium]|nr:undecaprenyl/decaprenyl-phosphate alpha-N-acetylglucosaminyl 1-phosphate transferase [bacterium]